jgi:hypothetical protein
VGFLGEALPGVSSSVSDRAPAAPPPPGITVCRAAPAALPPRFVAPATLQVSCKTTCASKVMARWLTRSPARATLAILDLALDPNPRSRKAARKMDLGTPCGLLLHSKQAVCLEAPRNRVRLRIWRPGYPVLTPAAPVADDSLTNTNPPAAAHRSRCRPTSTPTHRPGGR